MGGVRYPDEAPANQGRCLDSAHLPALGAIAGSSNLKLQAVYSRSRSSATALAELAKETLKLEKDPTVYSDDGNAKSGLDELLASAEIQAVIVVLPITQQPDVILRALKAGKHVLSEKPVGKDVRAGSSLINTYETEYVVLRRIFHTI